jgi:clusterin-associated protein 1
MDEYEKLEEELAYIYELYITKFRCLTFLEQQLEEIEENELEKIQVFYYYLFELTFEHNFHLFQQRDEQIKKMVEQMKQEELLRTETETGSIDDLIANDDEEETDEMTNTNMANETEKLKRPLLNTGSIKKRSATTGRVRMFGSILDGEKDDSLDSDLDLDQDDDEASDLDSEDEMELLNLTNTRKDDKKRNANEDNAKSIPNQNDSDNDF